MRKNSVVDLMLAKKIMAVVIILCHAVFLLPKGALAQSPASIFLGDIKISSPTAGHIYFKLTSNTPLPSVRYEIKNSDGVKVASLPGILYATSTYYADLATATMLAGTYSVRLISFSDQSSGVVVAETSWQVFNILPTEILVSIIHPPLNSVIGGNVGLSTKVSDPGVFVNYFYRLTASADKVFLAKINSNGSGIYNYNWDTRTTSNGLYIIIAEAVMNGAVLSKKEITANVFNAAVQNETSVIPVPLVEAQISQPAVEIALLSMPTSTILQRNILARTNQVVDGVAFIVEGNGQRKEYVGNFLIVSGYNNYSFVWDAQNFSAGVYTITAIAKKDGLSVASAPVQIEKINLAPTETIATTTIVQQGISTTTPTNSLVLTKIIVGTSALAGSVASGTILLYAKTTPNIKRIEFLKEKIGGQDLLGNASFDSVREYWSYKWDTTFHLNGNFGVLAVGYDEQGNKFFSENTIRVYVDNSKEIKTVVSTTSIQAILPEKNIVTAITPEEMFVKQPIVTTTSAQVQTQAKPIVVTEQKPVQTTIPTIPTTPTNSIYTKKVVEPVKSGNTSTTMVNVVDKPVSNSNEVAITNDCKSLGIVNQRSCDLHNYVSLATKECYNAGLSSAQECVEFLRSKFGEPAICQGISPERCNTVFTDVVVGGFISKKQLVGANNAIVDYVGKNIKFVGSENKSDADLLGKSGIYLKDNNLSSIGESDNNAILPVMPFANSEEASLTVLPAVKNEELKNQTVEAILSIDSDSDGLSDDIEIRLGTNKNSSDTDKDGYSDYDEVKSGHNPLGSGMLVEKLRPAEQAIVNRVPLEQPKANGVTNIKDYVVEKINYEEKTSTTSGSVRISGKALPDQVLSLFIYSSLPIVVTVKTDQNGNWSYNLDKTLTNGKHEAYVVLNNELGKIEAKSAPFSFFVNEARAVSQDDLLRADINVYNQTETMVWWYVAAGMFLIIFIAALFFLYLRSKKTTTIA